MEDTRQQIECLQRQIAALTTGQPASHREEVARAYARADKVAKHFGETVSDAVPGETAVAYRRRLAGQFQKHSERFKNARLDAFDSVTLNGVEEMIYQDALASAQLSASHTPGKLTPVTERVGGRDITKYFGDPDVWMSPFKGAGMATGHFTRPDLATRK